MLDARGVMEPWQEPRHGRGWLILLLGITVFAAFGAVVGYAYFKGLPGIGGEPPLIKAQEGPYRHAPSDRGGLAVPNTNSSIVTVLRPQNEPPRVERILPAETSPALESAEPDADIETDGGATRPAPRVTQYPGGGCGGDPGPDRSCCRDRLAIPALQTGAARAGGGGRAQRDDDQRAAASRAGGASRRARAGAATARARPGARSCRRRHRRAAAAPSPSRSAPNRYPSLLPRRRPWRRRLRRARSGWSAPTRRQGRHRRRSGRRAAWASTVCSSRRSARKAG